MIIRTALRRNVVHADTREPLRLIARTMRDVAATTRRSHGPLGDSRSAQARWLHIGLQRAHTAEVNDYTCSLVVVVGLRCDDCGVCAHTELEQPSAVRIRRWPGDGHAPLGNKEVGCSRVRRRAQRLILRHPRKSRSKSYNPDLDRLFIV